MQSINTRKYLTGSLLLSMGFAAVYALSRAENSACCPSLLAAQPPTANSRPGETNMIATNAPKTVEHANDANFRTMVLESPTPVLVDFYTQWCGPCKRLAPVLEEIAAETPNVRVVKVDVDENPNLARQYQIESIPSVKVFRNGRITAETLGLASKAELKGMLTR